MSAKIVNLRTERKRRERASDAEKASENRVRHGRTKAERGRDESRRAAADRAHEGARIEDGVTREDARGVPDEDRSDPS